MTVQLVFDLDGTISDPAVGIERSINYALSQFGYPSITPDQVAGYIGPPLDETFIAVTSNSSPDDIAALVSKYRERYAEVGYSENTLYPGIREALAALASSTARMGVCTSKRGDFADRILKLFEIRDYFEFVDGGDVGVRKEQQVAALLSKGLISSSTTIIGDRAVDIYAARANGAKSVGVLWGYGTLDELQSAGPNLILQVPEELSELRLHGI
ncbi:MAG TPA: HAD hydrolase-like protein [Pyrinomonadaceae bacterium]|nr:HAD hydrolase-like protein [Pyrinomonadaceae bacterium]